MVKKNQSLIWRIIWHGLLVLVVSFLSSLAIGRHLTKQGHLEAFRQIHIEQAQFIKEAVELEIAQGRDFRPKLNELDRLLHTESRFIPYQAKQVSQESFCFDRLHLSAVVRTLVRRNGRPLGTIQTRFSLPGFAKGFRPVGLALLFVLQLLLMTVPGLYFFVIRPLKRVTAAAERLGQGDLETPIKVRRHDEFGELEAAFEDMRQRIQAMLTQKDRFLRDVSHELRSPLTRLNLALSLARKEDSPYLIQMERDLKAMDELIGELLELTRIQTPADIGPQLSIDLREIAEDVLTERELLIRQKSLTIQPQLASATLRGDPVLLRRALGNLLDNAIKYAPEGGQIRIETLTDVETKAFRIWNDGERIPETDLVRIFEPFYRPDPSRSRQTGGTGVGLAIVKAIAEKHGGEAHMRSDETGTTVEMRFLP